MSLRATSPPVAADATFLEDLFQWAELGERGLQQVEANERGEPQPVQVVIMRQHQTNENEQAGKTANEHVHFHDGVIEPKRSRKQAPKMPREDARVALPWR